MKKKESKTPPVKVGDVLELQCISIGKKGDGIFKHERFVIISPDADIDKRYKLEITKVFPTIAFAKIVEPEGDE